MQKFVDDSKNVLWITIQGYDTKNEMKQFWIARVSRPFRASGSESW